MRENNKGSIFISQRWLSKTSLINNFIVFIGSIEVKYTNISGIMILASWLQCYWVESRRGYSPLTQTILIWSFMSGLSLYYDHSEVSYSSLSSCWNLIIAILASVMIYSTWHQISILQKIIRNQKGRIPIKLSINEILWSFLFEYIWLVKSKIESSLPKFLRSVFSS
jgi:hypothetical protein